MQNGEQDPRDKQRLRLAANSGIRVVTVEQHVNRKLHREALLLCKLGRHCATEFLAFVVPCKPGNPRRPSFVEIAARRRIQLGYVSRVFSARNSITQMLRNTRQRCLLYTSDAADE